MAIKQQLQLDMVFFEFLVMPMGLFNAPSLFQSLMNSVFYDYREEFEAVNIDDLLVFSKDETRAYETSSIGAITVKGTSSSSFRISSLKHCLKFISAVKMVKTKICFRNSKFCCECNFFDDL